MSSATTKPSIKPKVEPKVSKDKEVATKDAKEVKDVKVDAKETKTKVVPKMQQQQQQQPDEQYDDDEEEEYGYGMEEEYNMEQVAAMREYENQRMAEVFTDVLATVFTYENITLPETVLTLSQALDTNNKIQQGILDVLTKIEAKLK